MMKWMIILGLTTLPIHAGAESKNGSNVLEDLIMLKQRMMLEHLAGDGETRVQQEIRKNLDREKNERNKKRSNQRYVNHLSQSNPRIQAFEKQYVAPDGCDNWKNRSHMVECQNHKIRARKDFLDD